MSSKPCPIDESMIPKSCEDAKPTIKNTEFGKLMLKSHPDNNPNFEENYGKKCDDTRKKVFEKVQLCKKPPEEKDEHPIVFPNQPQKNDSMSSALVPYQEKKDKKQEEIQNQIEDKDKSTVKDLVPYQEKKDKKQGEIEKKLADSLKKLDQSLKDGLTIIKYSGSTLTIHCIYKYNVFTKEIENPEKDFEKNLESFFDEIKENAEALDTFSKTESKTKIELDDSIKKQNSYVVKKKDGTIILLGHYVKKTGNEFEFENGLIKTSSDSWIIQSNYEYINAKYNEEVEKELYIFKENKGKTEDAKPEKMMSIEDAASPKEESKETNNDKPLLLTQNGEDATHENKKKETLIKDVKPEVKTAETKPAKVETKKNNLKFIDKLKNTMSKKAKKLKEFLDKKENNGVGGNRKTLKKRRL